MSSRVIGALLLFLTSLACAEARQLPDGLMLGAATAAFQIEGAWNEDGKGESIWDWFLHKDNRENGDVACDSYHKWQEDIANIKALGLDHYRFSIAWTRILPNGTLDNINQKGVDFYMNFIKGLKEANIEPVVTLYHWDLPKHLHDLGGFLNEELVNYFEDYARLVFGLYGPYVKYWITFNEPLSVCDGGYGSGTTAPGLQLIGDGIYQCAYVLLKAHARAYRVYDSEFRNIHHGNVSLVLNTNWLEPQTNSTQDVYAQELAMQFYFGWFANPVFVGNWPEVMIERVANRSVEEGLARSRLPSFTEEEIQYINGTHDFFALNTYKVYDVWRQENQIGEPSFYNDIGASYSIDSQYFYPEGFRKLLNWINDRYKPGRIIVTENGLQTTDYVDDQDRISYISGYMNNMLDAIEQDKVDIFGYTVWSLMDNFEWGSYDSRYGLIRVDFEDSNRTRTWKESARWFQNVTALRDI